MRRLTVLLLVMLLAFAGCGSSKSSSSNGSSASATSTPGQSAPPQSGQHTHFAKTKFVLHAGLAFGAFHRYIYKPYKSGELGGGLLSHKLVKIKAALAAAFAYHEVRLALDDARSSKILSKVLSPLLALQSGLSSMRNGLRHGDTSAVPAANNDVNAASSASKDSGQPIADQPTPSLGG